MPTLIFGTGFEHRVATVGASAIAGAPIWTTITGTPTISTSVYRTGAASVYCNASASQVKLSRTLPASTRTLVAVVYVRFETLPDSSSLFLAGYGGGGYSGIGVDSNGKWYARCVAGTTRTSTRGPTAGTTWYRVDMYLDMSANPWTLDWAIEGIDETQATNAAAAADISQVLIGAGLSAVVTTALYFDDYAYSFSSGDYPIGPIEVKGYQPNSDGTHSNEGGFEDAGNAAISGSNPAYDQFDAVPISSLTEYVTQTGNGTGDYVEVNLADSAEGKDPVHVQVSVAMSADTATTDHAVSKVIDGASESTIFDGDPSQITDIFRTLGMPTKPSGGAWTEAAFNALKFRFGFSSDAAPDPRCGGVIAEAVFAPAGNVTIAVPAGSLSLSGKVPNFKRTIPIAIASLVLAGLAPALVKSIPVSTGSLAIAGQIPTVAVSQNVTIPVPVGSVALAGQAPTLRTSIPVGQGILNLTGFVPVVNIAADKTIPVPAGTLSLSGQIPALRRAIPVGTGLLALTGFVPGVVNPRNVAVPIGALTITGYVPVVEAGGGRTVQVPTGSLSMVGFAPTVVNPRNIAVPQGLLTLTGQGPTLRRNIPVGAGGLSIAGQVPALCRGIPVGTGTLALTGFVPGVVNPRTVQVPTGALALAGFEPLVDVSGGLRVQVPAGSLVLTGFAPELVIRSIVPLMLLNGEFELAMAMAGRFETGLGVAGEFETGLGLAGRW